MNKIFGIGTDIIRNSRIENLLQRPYKKRFISRVLHSVEIEEFNNITSLKLQARYLASRLKL